MEKQRMAFSTMSSYNSTGSEMEANGPEVEIANELKGISLVLSFIADSILEKKLNSFNLDSISNIIGSLEKVRGAAFSAVKNDDQLNLPMGISKKG